MYPYRLSKSEWLAWCCYISGMLIKQTAYSLDITVTTARSRLKEGRKKGAPLRFGHISIEAHTPRSAS